VTWDDKQLKRALPETNDQEWVKRKQAAHVERLGKMLKEAEEEEHRAEEAAKIQAQRLQEALKQQAAKP
jgi:hypothetical protein